MRKEVDFIVAHKQEMQELNAAEETLPTKREWQRFELTKELVAEQESQFKRVKNEERWNQLVDVFYPCLCKIAKIQGGRVELDINEETFFAQLVYIGNDLTLNNIFCTDLTDFSSIVSAAEDIFVSVKEECFKFRFIFHLYSKIQIEDHSKEIAEINKKIQRYRFENRVLHSDSSLYEDA